MIDYSTRLNTNNVGAGTVSGNGTEWLVSHLSTRPFSLDRGMIMQNPKDINAVVRGLIK